ncbi:asparagine synthase, partial [Sulfurimonas sp. MAG313]
GLITAIASEKTKNLKTFTVSFDGEYDEAPLAAQVALKYNTTHHELQINFDNLEQDLPSILGSYGEPFFDSSAIPSYYVSKAAKEHVTVILNGDGADEIFGGYRRYIPYSKVDFFNLSPMYKKFFKLLLSLLPLANKKKSMYNYLYRLTLLASKSGVSQYISTTTDIFEDYEYLLKSPALLNDMKTALDGINVMHLDGVQKLMLMDFKTILNGDLLVKMDIATMAHSLEGRSPFLSKELLSFAPSLPSSYHVQGKTTKRLLRDLAKKYLPENIIHQPKRGFEIPLKKWVNNDLKSLINDTLGANAYVHNYIEKQDLNNLLNNTLSIPAEKRAKMLWTLLSLELWHQKHYK